MVDCVFCKIVSEEISGEKIYEDDNFIAILDIHPYVLGHCLVIPKEHVKDIWEIEKYEEFMVVVRKLANILKEVFDTDLVQGGIAGVDVAHAHFHLFPRTDKGRNGFPSEPMNPKPSEVEMGWVVEKINEALGVKPEDSSKKGLDDAALPSIADL